MKPQPTQPTTISTLCLRAADVIRERGWCQETCMDEKGSVCLLGALLTADGIDLLAAEVVSCSYLERVTERAIERHINHDSVPGWNDKEGRTVEEVIAVLEATAWENAAVA